MDVIDFKNTYWNYYLQIEKGFFETAPYCTIDKDNDRAFSVKYLQLHLSICSEIDTICKTFCKVLDENLDMGTCGITDYIKIFSSAYPTFANEIVQIKGYKYRDIQPWKGIDKEHIPNWWNVYNDVKHHRDSIKNNKENYKHANQKNLIEALCALYILIEYWAAKNIVTKEEEKNREMIEFKSDNLDLVKWATLYSFYMSRSNSWFDCERYFKYIEQEEQQ